jgi:tetratricopeptide (TPR) repeat protein
MGLMANGVVLGHLFMAGRYEEVLTEGTRVERLFPDHPTIKHFQAAALWQLGRYEESLEKQAQSLGVDHPYVRTARQALEDGGPEAAMRANADRLAGLSKTAPVAPESVARCYAQAGDLDPAFEWLERAFEERTPQLLHVAMDPRYSKVRADPRYNALLHRIGFPARFSGQPRAPNPTSGTQ